MNAVGIDVSKGKSMVAIMRPFGENFTEKKELQDLGVTKIPTSEKIQKRIESLESEQAAVICEKQELQKKHGIIQQNFFRTAQCSGNANSSIQSRKNSIKNRGANMVPPFIPRLFLIFFL